MRWRPTIRIWQYRRTQTHHRWSVAYAPARVWHQMVALPASSNGCHVEGLHRDCARCNRW